MRKRRQLIPLEKSENIIRLDKRGARRKITIGSVIWGLLSLLSFLYCLTIGLFMGYGTLFFLVWAAIAVFCGMICLLLTRSDWLGKIPKWLKWISVVAFMIGLTMFVVVEGMILSGFWARPKAGADYCIVLGAQWKESGPSYTLKLRLDAALEYLRENPDTMVIVSGGQGANEPVSEAEGMKGYLMNAGMEEHRILVEDTSVNTYENLLNSSSLLDRENDRVVVVTNNFHIFRACGIASRQGYRHLEGLAADSHPGMLANNLLREFMGVIKDTLVGNM